MTYERPRVSRRPTRPQPEHRTASEALGGRPVAEDQARDRGVPLGALELLGDERTAQLADRHDAGRVGQEVARPGRVGPSGGDEQRPVVGLDEPDGRPGRAAR